MTSSPRSVVMQSSDDHRRRFERPADVLLPDPAFGPASARALRGASGDGRLIACEVVWAEVVAAFDDAEKAANVMDQLTVGFSAMSASDATVAGGTWRTYHERGGTRQRVIADFLIGAHAWAQADRLLSRDRGFFRSYFDELVVVDPTPG